MKDWFPSASATMVGSMPHSDRRRVIDFVLEQLPEIPVWPQLSAFPAEGMMTQYLEGLPGLADVDGRLLVRTDSPEMDAQLLAFYEEYLEVESESRALDESRFRLGPENGRTFFEFVETLRQAPPAALRAVKGQIVGPFTLLAGLKDQNDRPTLYDERLQDAVVKLLAMKARWQVQRLKASGRPVIIFLDEPALAGFGSSAFISVSRELIHGLLEEVIAAVHLEGALAGIHVCANTDWLLAFQSSVDIINFDAYNYFDKFMLYAQPLRDFLTRGGIVAWGVVPTSDPSLIGRESAPQLADRWFRDIESLTTTDLPVATVLLRSLFTPSCGCGSLSEEKAESVVKLTNEVGEIMKSSL